MFFSQRKPSPPKAHILSRDVHEGVVERVGILESGGWEILLRGADRSHALRRPEEDESRALALTVPGDHARFESRVESILFNPGPPLVAHELKRRVVGGFENITLSQRLRPAPAAPARAPSFGSFVLRSSKIPVPS